MAWPASALVIGAAFSAGLGAQDPDPGLRVRVPSGMTQRFGVAFELVVDEPVVDGGRAADLLESLGPLKLTALDAAGAAGRPRRYRATAYGTGDIVLAARAGPDGASLTLHVLPQLSDGLLVGDVAAGDVAADSALPSKGGGASPIEVPLLPSALKPAGRGPWFPWGLGLAAIVIALGAARQAMRRRSVASAVSTREDVKAHVRRSLAEAVLLPRPDEGAPGRSAVDASFVGQDVALRRAADRIERALRLSLSATVPAGGAEGRATAHTSAEFAVEDTAVSELLARCERLRYGKRGDVTDRDAAELDSLRGDAQRWVEGRWPA